jgi:hypothetical protein
MIFRSLTGALDPRRLTLLVGDRAGSLAGGLAGSLAFPAPFARRRLERTLGQCLDVFHVARFLLCLLGTSENSCRASLPRSHRFSEAPVHVRTLIIIQNHYAVVQQSFFFFIITFFATVLVFLFSFIFLLPLSFYFLLFSFIYTRFRGSDCLRPAAMLYFDVARAVKSKDFHW